MDGVLEISLLSLSIAIGSAGIYLVQSTDISSRSQRFAGFAVATLGLLLLTWFVVRLPLHDPALGAISSSVPILIALGFGTAASAGSIAMTRSRRSAILGFCFLCALAAGILALQAAWLTAAAILFAGGTVAFVGRLFQMLDANHDASPLENGPSIEPFLSCVAGGILALTIITTFCGVAVARTGLASSSVGVRPSEQTKSEWAPDFILSSPSERWTSMEATIAIAIVSITAASRICARGASVFESTEHDSAG